MFDASGRPRPPQVCIDFVLDTFERAGGTWWEARGGRRQRVVGRLLFDDTELENRRSVERFIDFARVWPQGERSAAPRSAERLTLNLFSDVCVIARRERRFDSDRAGTLLRRVD